MNQYRDRQQTHVKLLRRLAQGGVVLLHKVPANLVLREIIARGVSSGRVGRDRGGRVLLSASLVLVLLREAAIGCHGVLGEAWKAEEFALLCTDQAGKAVRVYGKGEDAPREQ
jgi:hypothetical protein